MTDSMKISRQKPSDPALDYAFLRQTGLEYVERLAGRIWTDYNLHDPGITTLELLCYAITDLAYRTTHPVQDILASDAGADNHFYSARTILPSHPATINDYRRLLIDIHIADEDVRCIRNAWLRPADGPLYEVNRAQSKLSHPDPAKATAAQTIRVRGFYDVLLDLDDACVKDDVVDQVKSALARNRNLCEDFLEPRVVESQSFILCAEIDLASDADPAEVQAGIVCAVQEYLAPTLRFHTLEEVLAKGRSVDEIFDGPALDHGFIDADELEKADLRTTVRLSDVIEIVMAIEGVTSIRDILINPKGQTSGSANKWVVPVQEGLKPILDDAHSRIVFYKELQPMRADPARFEEALTERRKAAKAGGAGPMDVPVPKGRRRDISRYYPMQNHLPQCYGVGLADLPVTAHDERQAKARQLKAYLSLFDQLLANYFAHLSAVRQLFSHDSRDVLSSENDELRPTYVTQAIEGFEELYTQKASEKGLGQTIQELMELPEDIFDRRNRFLDHLLARFAERFSDYVWDVYSGGPGQIGQRQKNTIRGKVDFLSDYPRLSRERGKAFDCTDKSNLWDTDNVSGLERRVAALLGIANANRRNLANGDEAGFFLVEHILLLPPDETDAFLPISVSTDQTACPQVDPYSFRISIVAPGWGRFADLDFRRVVEETLRRETPAHILPRVCWVDKEPMAGFESAYRKWLIPNGDRESALRDLIARLSSLRSHYPPARLATCGEGTKPEDLWILDRTPLGSE
jgi:hypothetical protein